MKKSLQKDEIALINRSYICYFTADPQVMCMGTGMAKSTHGLPVIFTRWNGWMVHCHNMTVLDGVLFRTA